MIKNAELTPQADVGRSVATVAVFDHDHVRLSAVDLPARRPGEIDITITTAAICGSDLHTVLRHRTSPPLAALGHEGIGLVADADADATDARGRPLRVGDKVVLSMISSCGHCDRCQSGLTMKCRTLQKYGHDSVTEHPYATGMLADRVRLLPTVPVVAVPAEVDDALLVSAGCAGATAAAVLAAVDPAFARTPGAALVLGAGAVGFFCAAMLATRGFAVTVRDPSAARLALVQATGAVADTGERAEFPVVVEASGHPAAFADAIAAAAVGGQVVAAGSVSLGATTVTLDPAELVTRRLRLTGIHNYTTADLVCAVDWLLEHGRDAGVGRLTSPVHPLGDVAAAFEEMRRGTYARVLVSAGQSERPDVRSNRA